MFKPKYPIVLVDADETVFDFKKAERCALKYALNTFGKDCSRENISLYSDINLKCWKMLEAGAITREQLQILRFKEWFEPMNIDLDPAKFNEVYVSSLAKFGFLLDGAEEFLKKLSSVCDVYIVTNGLLVAQLGRFAHSPVKPYIKKIYISEALGYSKPQKEYFDYCFNDIGEKDKSKYIILGDSLTSDMQGGRNAGIATCHFLGKAKLTGSDLCDYEISDYDSFFEILKSS